jgi:5'-3' exonuclease
LLIDANSFIYDVVYEHTEKIYERVFQKIMDLVKKLNASSVFVAFDGVAPLAKMKQQKQRRYKSWLLRKMLRRTTWNTNAITPGTPFMNDLDKYLKEAFAKTPYLYSGPNEVGEGEQKLFAYARANPTPHTFVYGLDADLIMLSLLHLRHSKHIFLYRETKHFSYMKGIRANEDYAFSVDDMAVQICKEMYQNGEEIEKAVDHYCFLCFLCGNDFLPHFPSIQIRNDGIQYLLFHFSKELLVEGTKIHWDGVKLLFLSLAKNEKAMIQENLQWKKRQRTSAKNEEEEIQLIPLRDIREV